jgi:membrane protein
MAAYRVADYFAVRAMMTEQTDKKPKGLLRRLFNWESRVWHRVFGQSGGLPTLVRYSGTLIRGVLGDQIWVRAGYMTYLSLLHLVPLGAFALAATSRLGWESFLIDWLQTRLAPTAPELADKLIVAMDGLNLFAVGTLGLVGIGIAGLFALMQLEHDLDDIWVVRGRRPMWKSIFFIYPFAIFVAPLLVAVALASGALAEAQSRIWLDLLATWGPTWLHTGLTKLPLLFELVPYIVTWLMLTAVYYVVPSGPVRFRAALVGGVIAGVIWQVMQGFYLNFQFASATFREAWGYLAQIPLLLIWIFLSWFILFLGAEIAFLFQYRRAFMPKWPENAIPAELREHALVAIAREVVGQADRYPRGMTALKLSTVLVIPWRLVVWLCDDLADIGAVRCHRYHRHVRYQPVVDLNSWTTAELINRWRQHAPDAPDGIATPTKWPDDLPIGTVPQDSPPENPVV